MQCADLRQAERCHTRRDALRPCQRLRDRRAHVGIAELREHRAVDVFDQRVDDALGMDDDLDLLPRRTEEPMRLDDFEALVHHRRRIDRDLAAHAPARMGTGLLRGNAGKLAEWRGAERAARCGKQDPPYAALFRRACIARRETLKDRVVLAVDRQQRCAAFPHGRHEDAAREHQSLLVGKQNALARARRRKRRRESRSAYDSGDDGIDFRQRRGFAQTFATCEHARRQGLPAHRRRELARRVSIE